MSEVNKQINRAADGSLYDPRARELLQSITENPLPLEALAAVRRTALDLHHQMRLWAAREGLSEGRLHLLMLLRLAPSEGLLMGTLAEKLRVTPRNITGLVDGLERDGLVLRSPAPHDRRSILVRLSGHGTAKVNELLKPTVERETAFAMTLSSQELKTLQQLCLRLAEKIEAEGEQPSGGAIHS